MGLKDPNKIAANIDILYNQLSMSIRSGEYGTDKHMKLYRKFKAQVEELRKLAEKTPQEPDWSALI